MVDGGGLPWGPYYLQPRQGGDERNVEDGLLLRQHQRRLHGLAPYGPKVSAETKAAIAAKIKAIKNGAFYEFTGPLYDQSGQAASAEGQEDERAADLYAMNWLVKGVIGSPKG